MTNTHSSSVDISPALRQMVANRSSVKVTFSENFSAAALGSVAVSIVGVLKDGGADSIVVRGTDCELQISGLLEAVANVGKSDTGEIQSMAITIPKKDNPTEPVCQITIRVL
jgi:hypothetical protein